MIKRNNKKGFTIVELVIVIAVIAILAAVLIPTFAGIINKAQQSSDIQAVRQMNTALTAAFAVEKPANGDMNAVIDALSENGFNSKKALVPVSKDYQFVWSWSNSCIVLINAEGVAVYPEGITYDASSDDFENLEQSVIYLDAVASDASSLAEAAANGQQKITLNSNVEVTADKVMEVKAGAEVEIDLNEKTISAGMVDSTKHANVLHVKGKVTLKNGTIETRNIMVYEGGELIIEEGVSIKAMDSDGGACIWVYEGAKVTLNGGSLESESFTYAIKNNGGDITINDGVSVTASRGAISNDGGTTTINGGSFTVTGTHASAAHVVYVSSGTVTVTGGEFINNGTGYDFCVDGGGTGNIKIGDTTLTAGDHLND